jgi:hypothetical protein
MMEEAPGVRLVEVWDELDPASKLALMEELVSIETKLLSMSFHRYVIGLHDSVGCIRLLILSPAMGAYTLRATWSRAPCQRSSLLMYLPE